MADYAGQIPAAPTFLALRDQVRGQLPPQGATTTYYYRTSGGSRGSATSLDAIPAGAVIERTVTA